MLARSHDNPDIIYIIIILLDLICYVFTYIDSILFLQFELGFILHTKCSLLHLKSFI